MSSSLAAGKDGAWLSGVLSYDRIKSVYKCAELQKARENFCVSLRSINVFTCMKPLTSSKILNEVSKCDTEPADVF